MHGRAETHDCIQCIILSRAIPLRARCGPVSDAVHAGPGLLGAAQERAPADRAPQPCSARQHCEHSMRCELCLDRLRRLAEPVCARPHLIPAAASSPSSGPRSRAHRAAPQTSPAQRKRFFAANAAQSLGPPAHSGSGPAGREISGQPCFRCGSLHANTCQKIRTGSDRRTTLRRTGVRAPARAGSLRGRTANMVTRLFCSRRENVEFADVKAPVARAGGFVARGPGRTRSTQGWSAYAARVQSTLCCTRRHHSHSKTPRHRCSSPVLPVCTQRARVSQHFKHCPSICRRCSAVRGTYCFHHSTRTRAAVAPAPSCGPQIAVVATTCS